MYFIFNLYYLFCCIVTLLQGEDSLAIYFVGSQIVAEVQKSNSSVVLRTSPVTAGEWHEVMLES